MITVDKLINSRDCIEFILKGHLIFWHQWDDGYDSSNDLNIVGVLGYWGGNWQVAYDLSKCLLVKNRWRRLDSNTDLTLYSLNRSELNPDKTLAEHLDYYDQQKEIMRDIERLGEMRAALKELATIALPNIDKVLEAEILALQGQWQRNRATYLGM